MRTVDMDAALVDGYVRLLNGLGPKLTLDLISRLMNSLKSTGRKAETPFYTAFGAWEGNESAEDLIERVHSARTSTPQREGL